MQKNWWLILVLTFSASCFQTRQVEPPLTSSSDWVSPTDYQILLDNFKKAVGSRNTQNYLRCFNQDSLVFIPATVVYTGNEILWDNWESNDEQTYFNNVGANIAITSGNSLSLEEVDFQSFASDSLKYIGSYTLRMNHNDTTLTTEFQGQMEMIMKLNGFNEWEIHRWTDIETVPDSSWSRLKLSFGQ